MMLVPQDPSVLIAWDTVDVVVGFTVDVDGLTVLVEEDFVEDFEDETEFEIPHAPPTGWHPVPQ